MKSHEKTENYFICSAMKHLNTQNVLFFFPSWRLGDTLLQIFAHERHKPIDEALSVLSERSVACLCAQLPLVREFFLQYVCVRVRNVCACARR